MGENSQMGMAAGGIQLPGKDCNGPTADKADVLGGKPALDELESRVPVHCR
jgi:hypothetical protein